MLPFAVGVGGERCPGQEGRFAQGLAALGHSLGLLGSHKAGERTAVLPGVRWQFWQVTAVGGWSEISKFIASPHEFNAQLQQLLL